MSTSGGTSGGGTLTQNPDTQYTGPAGGISGFCLAQPFPRWAINSIAVSGVNQSIPASAVFLAAGMVITKLGWFNGNVAAVTPLSQWLGIFTPAGACVARTADAGTAAVAANTPYQYSIAQIVSGASPSYTVATSGAYLLGVSLYAGTTVPEPAGLIDTYASGIQGTSPAYFFQSNGPASAPALPYSAPGFTAQMGGPYIWAS